MLNQKMNIVFLSSDEFAEHMSVVMTSILLNNNNYHIDFYVLTKGIEENKKNKINKLSNTYDCSINYISIDDSIFNGINPDFHYNSIETYYRLIAADCIKSIDKCLIIDIDTIVNGSLKEFWETDIDNFYCAATKDLYTYNIENYLKTIKYPPGCTYFNAGILLLNLKKIREERLVNKLLLKAKEIHKKVKFLEQDILNLVFLDRVRIVDSIYNYTTTNQQLEPDKRESWTIRHFNGPIKPWQNINNTYPDFHLYFYYKNFSPFYNKIKIFEIHNKDNLVFASDTLTPISTGNNKLNTKMLNDNTLNNIAHKNPYYAEMTAWYWVWKNFLQTHEKTEFIGFCHYRRFLDFTKGPSGYRTFSKRLDCSVFKETYSSNYSENIVYDYIKNYDVILPELHHLYKEEGTIYNQFVKGHPKEEIDKLINIIKNFYPDYVQDMEEFLNGTTGYFCLNYVMKTHLFEEFMTWTFDLLDKMEKITDWSKYTDYLTQKTPAYLMERFFNVWLRHKIRVYNIKILEREGILLNTEDIEKESDQRVYKIIPGVNIRHDGKTIRVLNLFGIKIKAKKEKKAGYNLLKIGKIKIYKYSPVYWIEKFYKKKDLKLVATLLVRDEIDILEENIKFHLSMGVDFIIATDNGSIDGSRDVLLKYQNLGVLKLIDEPSQDYQQIAWVDRMIKIAKKDYKADWIINLDADEFWYSEKGNLKEDLALLDKFNVIKIPSLFMYPDIEDNENKKFYDITNGQFETLSKCIHKTKGYKKIHMGAHDVDMNNKKSTFYSGISLFHYFMRSYKQFEYKVKISGEALLKNKKRKKYQGSQMIYFYKKYLNNELKSVYKKRLEQQKNKIHNNRIKDFILNDYKTINKLYNESLEGTKVFWHEN